MGFPPQIPLTIKPNIVATNAPIEVTANVVIAGGSTAALAAAFAAAEEGVRVVLIEPTDWIGGQLTSSGVPAVDEAWHKIKDPRDGRILVNVSVPSLEIPAI